MSCSTLNQGSTGLQVSMGALPEGYCPSSMQELANAIANRLIVSPNQAFTSFAIGSIEPSSNVGPWLKNCLEWFVFDDVTARYIPILNFTSNNFTNSQLISSTGVFTVPSGIYKIRVHAWGGGGGGFDDGSVAAQGGGGAGGYGRKMFDVTPNENISATIGSGGTSGNPPTAGGNTVFKTLVANGGAPGLNGSTSSGGTVAGADFSINGGASGNANAGQPGPGGSCPQGGSGGTASTANLTRSGIVPGGAGCGGYNGVLLGGNGANGAIFIEY